MPYIPLPEGLPGIRGLMAFSPATAKPMSELAEVLLRGESSLSMGERELIATSVSVGNGCHFCHSSHGAVAAHHLGGDETVDAVRRDPETAPVSDKLKALLALAGKVRRSGRDVTEQDVTRARETGATDKEIHDAVLIAAAFCMYNRYVDGLRTLAPADREEYRESGRILAEQGYVNVGDAAATTAG